MISPGKVEAQPLSEFASLALLTILISEIQNFDKLLESVNSNPLHCYREQSLRALPDPHPF